MINLIKKIIKKRQEVYPENINKTGRNHDASAAVLDYQHIRNEVIDASSHCRLYKTTKGGWDIVCTDDRLLKACQVLMTYTEKYDPVEDDSE